MTAILDSPSFNIPTNFKFRFVINIWSTILNFGIRISNGGLNSKNLIEMELDTRRFSKSLITNLNLKFILGVQINPVRFGYQKYIYFRTKWKNRLIKVLSIADYDFFHLSGNFRITSRQNVSSFKQIHLLETDRINLDSQ